MDNTQITDKNCFSLLLMILSALYAGNAFTAATANFSYYQDNRDFNTMALQVAGSDLPHDFSVWGFTDFHSDQATEHKQEDFTRSFSEYRLNNTKLSEWINIAGLGLQLEYNDSTPGNNNTVWRGGLVYKHKFGKQLWTKLRLLPLQSNDDSQISLIFGLNFNPWLSLTGFADYNIRSNKENLWVIEPQLNIRVSDNTYLLIESRYNGFEKNNATLDGTGLAVGVRYDL